MSVSHMGWTMAKIDLIKRPSLIQPKHLLRYVFFTEMQVEQAAKILNTIMKKDNSVNESDWQVFVLSSPGLYVKVMRKLRDVGLVSKDKGVFKISKDFSIAISKMAEYWKNIVESYEEGDRTIKF